VLSKYLATSFASPDLIAFKISVKDMAVKDENKPAIITKSISFFIVIDIGRFSLLLFTKSMPVIKND
jgi:hypothetical protein